MDGVLLDGRKGIIWFCKKNGHAVGLMVEDVKNDLHVKKLVVFRDAIPVVDGIVDLSKAKVHGVAEGTYKFNCTCCEQEVTWNIDHNFVIGLLAPMYGK